MAKSLSIVIPAYDEARYLRRCLEAIAKQSEVPDEVILVDNNSTDDTVAIAREYPFVTVVHESEQGIVYARNRGFDLSHSDIIGRIDADTVLPHDWVHTVKSFYEDPTHQKTVINGGTRFYNLHTGWFVGWGYDLVVHRLNRLLLGYHFPWGSNMALPAAAWREVRGEVCLTNDVHEDLDIGIHLHAKGYDTVYRAKMRVGAVARRILEDRGKLWRWMWMWKETLQRHGVGIWWLTVPVSAGIWAGSYGILAIEKLWSWLTRPIEI